MSRRLAARPAVSFLALLAAAQPARSQDGSIPGVASGWFTTSDDVRLHYLSGGSGRALVFVPGWTMPADIWEHQLRHFVRSHRVVALDPRSQGRSEITAEGNFIDRRVQDIEELLQHVSDGHAVLVGWSLAVPEILHLIEHHGTDRLAGIVLVDGMVSIDAWASAFVDTMLVDLLRDRRNSTEEFVRSMYRTPQAEHYLERITRASLATPTPTAYTLMASTFLLGDADWRPALSLVDRPLLFMGLRLRVKSHARFASGLPKRRSRSSSKPGTPETLGGLHPYGG